MNLFLNGHKAKTEKHNQKVICTSFFSLRALIHIEKKESFSLKIDEIKHLSVKINCEWKIWEADEKEKLII